MPKYTLIFNCLGGSSVSKQTEKIEKNEKIRKKPEKPYIFSLLWNMEELRQKS